MKKVFSLCLICLLAVSSIAQSDYVDLGLPSGTLWKDSNEAGYYAYDEAVQKFGSRLPTKAQLEELKDKCTWTWTGNSYKVTGPSGNSIFLPTVGFLDCGDNEICVGTVGTYWSSTPSDSVYAWYLYFDFYFDLSEFKMCDYYRCDRRSVRLVQNL